MRGGLVTFLLLTSIVLIVSHSYGKEGKAPSKRIKINATIVAADYKTLGECLETIQKNTGASLTVITEKPSQISGFLSNGGQFACVVKESEEKGNYIDGWYTVQ